LSSDVPRSQVPSIRLVAFFQKYFSVTFIQFRWQFASDASFEKAAWVQSFDSRAKTREEKDCQMTFVFRKY